MKVEVKKGSSLDLVARGPYSVQELVKIKPERQEVAVEWETLVKTLQVV